MNWKLWLVWLNNLSSYKNFSDQTISPKEEIIFEITRFEKRGGKPIHKKICIATYNKYTDIYQFDSNRFLTLDEMLDYVLENK